MAEKRKIWPWVAAGVGLVVLTVFTVFVAAPNVVTAGQKATERMAVATLRTLLWAQDQMIELHGRAGLVAELSGARPVAGAALPAPLLRPPFKALRDAASGQSVSFQGYEFAVYVFDGEGVTTDGGRAPADGARAWIAYAWPAERGVSASAAFCINGREEILATPNDGPRQGYDGLAVVPGPRACPITADGALAPGEGGDGGRWDWWRGQKTRRARAAAEGAN